MANNTNRIVVGILAIATVCALVLAGCGGGDSTEPPSQTTGNVRGQVRDLISGAGIGGLWVSVLGREDQSVTP